MDWVIGGLGIGVGVGIFYFVGLWLTVERMVGSGHPGSLAVGSLVVRVLVAGVAFGFVARGGALALVAALAGFVGVRMVAVRRWSVAGNTGRGTVVSASGGGGDSGMEEKRATHA